MKKSFRGEKLNFLNVLKKKKKKRRMMTLYNKYCGVSMRADKHQDKETPRKAEMQREREPIMVMYTYIHIFVFKHERLQSHMFPCTTHTHTIVMLPL